MKAAYLSIALSIALGSGIACSPKKSDETPPGSDTNSSAGDPNEGYSDQDVPTGWTCDPYQAQDNTCDCGCMVKDPDCATGAGCLEPGCTDLTCGRCHDAQGRDTSCNYAGWTCRDHSYGDFRCDCSCGIADPDCNGAGCITPGCKHPACYYCHDADGKEISCAPDEWTCPAKDYSGFQCDCGCGVYDPACLPGSCVEANNTDCIPVGCTGASCNATGCDICHNATGEAYNCASPPPSGWTCPDIRYGDPGLNCDCGCGIDDPACNGYGCTGSGCDDSSCNRCHLASLEVNCGHVPPSEWTCDLMEYGDSTCDCGCGAQDDDCSGTGCTTPNCVVADCVFCHDNQGRFFNCDAGAPDPSWTCDPAVWGDTMACDCGCGAMDPDCSVGGCTTPGCSDVHCEICHDADGYFESCN